MTSRTGKDDDRAYSVCSYEHSPDRDAGSTAPAPVPTTAPSTPSTSGSATGATPATGTTITIHNFAFSPAQLTVHPGQKVSVVNTDTTAHTVTANQAGLFATGSIPAGASAQFTAPAAAGAYDYICSIHPFMHGTLTVG
jgi:plastocyanin